MRRGVAFDQALQHSLGELPDPDRRLAHQLAAGVLRQQQTLDHMLSGLIARGLPSVKEPLTDILRLGAYQLRSLERIPPHAAVTTSVELAREQVGERATGFANAVLRRVAALGADPAVSDSDEPAERLAVRYAHPRWLVDRWLARFGEADTERLLTWNNTTPALVLQPARATADALAAALAAEGVAFEAGAWDSGLIIERGRADTPTRASNRPERLAGYEHGAFIVQDRAQALVGRFAAFPEGAMVFDACAAPGGKALALARSHPLVIAADRSRKRLVRVRGNVARAGSGNIRLLVADAAMPPIRSSSAYLLDAPCLATGSLARHPEARHRITEAALHHLAGVQRALLDAAAARITPGGVLCYATCSLEPEENEDQVNAFLTRHPEFRREPPDGFPRELLTPAGDLATFPHRDGMDGAYAARLVRSA